MQSMLSNHNGLKLEINNKDIFSQESLKYLKIKQQISK